MGLVLPLDAALKSGYYIVASDRLFLMDDKPEWVTQREKELLSQHSSEEYSRWCALPLPSKRLMHFVKRRIGCV